MQNQDRQKYQTAGKRAHNLSVKQYNTAWMAWKTILI